MVVWQNGNATVCKTVGKPEWIRFPPRPPFFRKGSKMAGRIETYIHSDTSVPNKGGSLVEVKCATDFAARTIQFATFAKDVAKMAYASGKTEWAEVIAIFPNMEDHRKEVSDVIGERVTVEKIVILTVAP